MRVLVTRPQPDADSLAREVAALGHEAVVEPLFDIVPVPAKVPEIAIAASLLTSRNAARHLGALAGREGLLAKPVYCVGAASAAAARAAGFADVREAAGDGAALVAAVIADPPARPGALLHLRGRHTRGVVAAALTEAGHTVAAVTIYASEARPALSPATVRALAAGEIGAAVLFSPRAAFVFAGLLARAGLTAPGGFAALCLSPAVAEALGPLGAEIRVAGAPTRAALLALLG
jgi:uroporphyrinogen-III synthase